MDENLNEIEQTIINTSDTIPKAVKNIDILGNVPVIVRAKLGSRLMTVEEILDIEVNQVIQLDSNVGDVIPLYANNVLFAYGEIVVVNDDIGVRISKIINEALNEI